jgi:hypothetical protein
MCVEWNLTFYYVSSSDWNTEAVIFGGQINYCKEYCLHCKPIAHKSHCWVAIH